jgi:hypothetical protein
VRETYDPVAGWREGNNANPGYEGRAVMALLIGECEVRVLEYTRRRFEVQCVGVHWKVDCGRDLRLACQIARRWAGVGEETL